ncbi:MAG: GNAT family N-acetyltransferase [Candidatus Thermoplasmatota archaeon]
MEETEKERRWIKLSKIQPSELHLSSQRLEKIQEMEEEIGPLPIKSIGDKVFFTDGHHRAFKLWKRGEKEVEVYEDETDMDWLKYLICVHWCEKANLESIVDLRDRIVEEKEFRKLWIEKCQKMQERVDEDIFEFIDFREEKDPDVKSDICKKILEALPKYFGIEEAVKDYTQEVRDMYSVSASVGDTPVGFTALKEHNEFTSEVYVLGVLEELQRRGIGKRLMNEVEAETKSQGKKYLTVKTLGPSRLDEGYQKTRAFYRSAGFVPLEEFTTLWNEDNPCLLMVKSIE